SIFDHDHPQRLHAKGCAIVRGDRVRLVFGSANFTRAGLFSTAADGNVEAVLVANELTLKSCDPERLFDPCKTARSEPLRTSPRPKEPSQPPTQVRLVEAALDEDHLSCRIETPDGLSLNSIIAVLTARDGASNRVHLRVRGAGTWDAVVERSFVRRCNDGT